MPDFTHEEISVINEADLRDLTIDELVNRQVGKHSRDFDVLMDELEGLDTKIKSLWKEIYQNAVTDRVLAHVNLLQVMNVCGSNHESHGIYGPIIAKYLERMEKATNQVIKLVELVEDYKRHAGANTGEIMTEDQIYEKISGSSPRKH